MSVDRPPERSEGGLRPFTEEIADLVADLYRRHGRRVHIALLPDDWTTDQGIRLTRAVNKVLDAGEPGLRTVEDAVSG